ncbi:MAG: fused MFS/spermidine synthase [Desulfovibrionaceae bacterium]
MPAVFPSAVPPASRGDRLVLAAVFLVSGASALLFETLWFRLAGLVFGVSAQASALVLSSFMGGLALGNALIARFGRDVTNPVRFYAIMELLVGIWGALLVLGFPLLSVWLGAMLQPVLAKPILLNSLRFSFSFLLFLLPATAMGVTLPLLVKALARRPGEFGRALGGLYGSNTLGACLGALAGETLCIAPLGLAGTGLLAAGLNLAAAAGALFLAPRFRDLPSGTEPPTPPKAQSALTGRARRLLGAGFLAGGAFLALEVVWTRFLQLFVRSTNLAFAVMLAVILAGIGLGGLLAGWWLAREADGRKLTAPLSLAVAVAGLASFTVLGPMANLSVDAYQSLDWRYVALLSLTLMFPAALASGLLFTALGEAIHREIGDRTRSAGLLTMANTLGAMVGPLVAGFLLLPALGMEKSLYGLCALYLVPAALCTGRARPWPSLRSPFLLATLIAFAACLIFFPFGATRDFLDRAVADYRKQGEVVEATIEGVTGTLQYLRRDYLGQPYSHRLVTDGYSMAATEPANRRYMKLFAYFPEAVLPNPKTALLICYGTGTTASALVEDKRLTAIDVVDISRDILTGSHIIHPQPGTNPLDDPRVKTHVEDGRFFLLASRRKFDIITAEPPPPMMAGVVNLYTREYFSLMRDRLTDGGMVTYWLPVFELSEADTKAILKAFCEVFDHASLWTGFNYNWMLVGVKKTKTPKSGADFASLWNDPVLGRGLRDIAVEEPGQLTALFMADRQAMLSACGEAKPLTDNFPKRLTGYPDSPESQQRAIAAHTKFMDALAARDRFMASPEAAALFPLAVREAARPWFETQHIINVFLNNRIPPPPPLQGLNYVLGATELQVLPLWLMHSDTDKQALVDKALASGLPPSGETEFQLGVGALAARNYRLAEAKFARAQALGYPGNLTLARIYILCLAGEMPAAEDLAKQAFRGAGNNPSARAYANWLSRTFGLASPF